jgi:hypothetical protein
MRKIDKLINLAKANLLTEQRYLEAKGSVNELSPELKQAAYNKASYQASVHGNANSPDTLNPLKADRRRQQAHAIGNSLPKKYETSVNDIGNYLGLNGAIKKVADTESQIVLTFDKKDEYSGRATKLLQYNIFKNKYTANHNNNVQVPDNYARRIERFIITLQKNELSDSDNPYES